MDLESLKNQSVGELIKLSRKLKDELFQLKFQHTTQQLKTPHKLRELRRDIARAKMVTAHKVKGLELGAAKGPAKAAAPKQAAVAPTKKEAAPKKEAAAKTSKKKKGA